MKGVVVRTRNPVRRSDGTYVRFDSNRYSVPHDRVRRQLVVRANSVRVKIFDRDELVAEHRRCWDKQQVVENPEHIAALVRDKRKASRHRAQERLLRVVPQCEALLAEIGRRQRHLATAVARLTGLLDLFGRHEMGIAVAEALAKGSPSVETVQLILDRVRAFPMGAQTGESIDIGSHE